MHCSGLKQRVNREIQHMLLDWVLDRGKQADDTLFRPFTKPECGLNNATVPVVTSRFCHRAVVIQGSVLCLRKCSEVFRGKWV